MRLLRPASPGNVSPVLSFALNGLTALLLPFSRSRSPVN
jgi:hypothetical protein